MATTPCSPPMPLRPPWPAVVASPDPPAPARSPVAPEEHAALGHLSPAGIAKVNADAARGVPFEDTLADLMAVFAQVQERKAHISSTSDSWGPKLKGLVRDRCHRPLTSLEVSLLLDITASPVHAPVLHRELQRQLRQGDLLADILEDVVFTVMLRQLQQVARRLRQGKKTVRVSTLVHTVRPKSTSLVAEPSQCGPIIRLGLSPLVSWFMDDPSAVAAPLLDRVTVTTPVSIPEQTPDEGCGQSCGATDSPLSAGSCWDAQDPLGDATSPPPSGTPPPGGRQLHVTFAEVLAVCLPPYDSDPEESDHAVA